MQTTLMTVRRCCAGMVSAFVLAAALPAASQPARGAGGTPPAPGVLEACAQLRSDADRLACYDKAMAADRVRGGPRAVSAASAPAGVGTVEAASVAAAAAAASSPTAVAAVKPVANDSYLDEFWELSPDRKRGVFNFDGYRPSYFFPLHVSSRMNLNPTTPSPGHTGSLPDYRRVEAKLQISVRTKLAQDVGLPGADFWFAYTQQSLWQLYSAGLSRPFRATDHEPELFYIVPTPFDLPLGWKLKMVGLGLAHQSNGQALPYSRSWNRTYALAGVENGQFALTARYNQRIHESDGDDDNPDLTDYRGRTDLLGVWSPGVYTLSTLWRTNFTTRRGSLQIDWTMPVNRKDPKGLRWYAQVFTGYGESLIDYNFRQTSLGAGVTLFGW